MQKLIIVGALALILLVAYAFYAFTNDSDRDLGGNADSESGPAIEMEDETGSARRFSSEVEPSMPAEHPDERRVEPPTRENTSSGLLGFLVHASTKEAVPAAMVRFVDLSGREIARSESDAKGRFLMPVPSPRPEGHLRASTASLALEPRLMPALEEPLLAELGILMMNPTVNIVGKVLSADDKPVAGARVELYSHTMFDMMNFDLVSLLKTITSEEPPLLLTATDDQGSFRFEEVPARDWTACAIKKGHGTRFCKPFSASPDHAGEIVIKLATGGALAGKIQDEGGVPLANIRVLAFPKNNSPEDALRTLKTTSGADGTFSLDDVGAGELQLFARGRGYVPKSQVETSAPKDDLVFIMTESGRIHGKVTNAADDSPLVGVEVLGMQMESSSFEIAYTDAEGHYELLDMPKYGQVMLLARKPGYALKDEGPKNQRGFGMPGVAVPETDLASGNAERNIVMTAGTGLSGQVVDQLTGAGIAGVKIRYMGAGGGFGNIGLGKIEVISDEAGNFKMAGLPAGRFVLLPTKTGYFSPRSAEGSDMNRLYDMNSPGGWELVEGQELAGLQVKLQAGVNLQGRVVDDQGEPVQGAYVRSKRQPTTEEEDDWSYMGDWVSTDEKVLSDQDGNFTIPGLEPHQTYIIGAQHRKFPSSENQTARVGEKQLEKVVVRLLPPGAVKGRLMKTDGSPAAQVKLRVHVSRDDGFGYDPNSEFERNMEAVTDANGRFEFTNVAPGSHSVWLDDDSEFRFVDDDVQLEVEAGKTSRVEIKVVTSVYIDGIVVDEKGQPVAGVWLTAQRVSSDAGTDENGFSRGGDSTAYTEADGKFRLSRLHADLSYRVSAKSWKMTAAPAASMEEEIGSYEEVTLATVDNVAAGQTGLRLQVKRADVSDD